jgi:hypothetical protein
VVFQIVEAKLKNRPGQFGQLSPAPACSTNDSGQLMTKATNASNFWWMLTSQQG